MVDSASDSPAALFVVYVSDFVVEWLNAWLSGWLS